MLGNFLSFSIVAIGIGILFSFPVFLSRVQKPNQLAPSALVVALSFGALLTSYVFFAFISATINNTTGTCSTTQESSLCIPAYSEQAVLDSMLARELWLRNLLPPPMRNDICFVQHSWICENAAAILDISPQWNDYLYQSAFGLLSCLSCLLLLFPFVKGQVKEKIELSNENQTHPL